MRLTGEQQGLVGGCVRLAYHLARRLHRGAPHLDLEELEALALLALVEAARRFDAGRGVKFATYATRCVEGQLLYARGRMRKDAARRSAQLDPEVMGEDGRLEPRDYRTPDGDAQEGELRTKDRERVRAMLGLLEGRPGELRVVEGIMAGRSLADIGREMGVSRTRVAQLRDKAFERIKGAK